MLWKTSGRQFPLLQLDLAANSPGRSLDSSTWDAMPDGEGFVMIQDHTEPRAPSS